MRTWRSAWEDVRDERARRRLRRWTATWGRPIISILIPSRDHWRDLLRPCLLSLERTTRGTPIEVIVADSSSAPALRSCYEEIGLPYLVAGAPFSFARACNALAAAARGDYLLFLNNDTTAVTVDWAHRLLARPPRGVVGALLVFPGSGRLQHAGVEVARVTGQDDVPDAFRPATGGLPPWPLIARHIGVGAPLADAASLDRSRMIAVTGAWLCTPRALFTSLGGFDEAYETDLQDTDYCLRVRARGLPVTCAPDIVFTHAQSATRGAYDHPHADWSLLRSRWERVLERCAGPATSAVL